VLDASIYYVLIEVVVFCSIPKDLVGRSLLDMTKGSMEGLVLKEILYLGEMWQKKWEGCESELDRFIHFCGYEVNMRVLGGSLPRYPPAGRRVNQMVSAHGEMITFTGGMMLFGDRN
jgi:hypothetical protein